MPGLVQEIVGAHLTELEDRDIHVMVRDCEFQSRTPGMYGDEKIDKPDWLRWEAKVRAEQERRNGRTKKDQVQD